METDLGGIVIAEGEMFAEIGFGVEKIGLCFWR